MTSVRGHYLVRRKSEIFLLLFAGFIARHEQNSAFLSPASKHGANEINDNLQNSDVSTLDLGTCTLFYKFLTHDLTKTH